MKKNDRMGLAVAIIGAALMCALVFYSNNVAQQVLFESSFTGGPCATPDGCHSELTLFYSGRLVRQLLNGTILETRLDTQDVNEIINQIRASEIMEKNCSANISMTTDVFGFCNITLDGQSKVISIHEVACSEELDIISTMIESAEQGYYVGCGCGCCGGVTDPTIECLYHSKGDNLMKIVAQDVAASHNPDCVLMGCTLPVKYTYCD